jgi:hypothetical protein
MQVVRQHRLPPLPHDANHNGLLKPIRRREQKLLRELAIPAAPFWSGAFWQLRSTLSLPKGR